MPATTPQEEKNVYAFDPDISLLAAEAAVDIDNLLMDRSRNLKAIRTLAEKLKNSIELDPSNQSPRSLIDSTATTLLCKAVFDSKHGALSPKINDLLSEALRMAECLSNDSILDNREELETIRDFCISLSSTIMDYYKSLRDLRPQHPFRK